MQIVYIQISATTFSKIVLSKTSFWTFFQQKFDQFQSNKLAIDQRLCKWHKTYRYTCKSKSWNNAQ